MGKYLDPRADLTFKKVFGEHKHLVISLLNALLPLKDDERVESIEYWPAEKVPDRPLVEKDSIVDVCCKDNKNREFIVEMQMTWTDSFKKRVLLNASKAYVAQSKKGDDYELLQPVYALNFVNENFMNDVDEYYHYYHLVHDKYTDKVIDGLHLIFVELKKFKPQTYTEKKMQVLWLRFLTEINDETREAPAELLENAEVSEALEIVERAAFDDGEMRAYDKFWDNVSVLKTLENARKRELEAAEKAKAEVVGPWVSIGASAFIIMMSGPMTGALWFVLLMLGIQLIEDNVVYPRLIGGAIGMTGLEVLAAVIISGGVFGLAGLLAAVPVSAVIRKLLHSAIDARNAKRAEQAETA